MGLQRQQRQAAQTYSYRQAWQRLGGHCSREAIRATHNLKYRALVGTKGTGLQSRLLGGLSQEDHKFKT